MTWAFLQAWLATVVIEVPIVAWCFPAQRRRMAVVCLAATTATHAAMHFLLPPLVDSLGQWVIVGESSATVLEAAVYAVASRPRSLPRALIASALANGLSFAAGLLLFR